jgi:hypothetical protein
MEQKTGTEAASKTFFFPAKDGPADFQFPFCLGLQSGMDE